MSKKPYFTEEEIEDCSWIVFRYDCSPNVFLCERCGVTYPTAKKGSARILLAIAEEFTELHKECAE